MVTENFKNILACMLQADLQSNNGRLRVIDVYGNTRYVCPNFTSWPYSVDKTFAQTLQASGISLGTGSTPTTEFDYNLESMITTGIAVTVASVTHGCKAPASPYIEYSITITNTSSDPLTITEVGYKQKVKATTTPMRLTDISDTTVLFDRTVLSTPLTIPAGEPGILVYRLESIPSVTQIDGVDIVSWEYGSDAQLGAMIDAARAGIIDLQRDAGWRVGDVRKIQISAFTGGNNVSHEAQDIDIAITSFDDYNECGCVMQFDFMERLVNNQRMNPTSTTTGGYGATEMFTDTLPALVNALPEWLSSRLISFDVIATIGANSTTMETVTGNKLALRSTMEVFGSKQTAKAAEGSQIFYYASDNHAKKRIGHSGSFGTWWLRSPNSSTSFCSINTNGTASNTTANSVSGFAPFGCI